MQIAQIKIKNLRLRTIIGINAEEKRDKQDIIINAIIDYGCEDFKTQSLNYRTITKELINLVEGSNYDYLEELTQDLLNKILSYNQVTKAQVEVDKPNALRFSDSVSITLTQIKKLN